MLRIIFLFAAILFFTACTSAIRYQKNVSESDYNSLDENEDALEAQTGVASYYADKYHGKITYSGEVFDMNGLSAAHPTYRMGTIVRVTNLFNNKVVTIPINDRMPFRPDRIIDLSLGTAKELDMVRAGIVDVKVEVLKWGEGKK